MPTIVIDIGHGTNNRAKGKYDPGAVAGRKQEHVIAEGMAYRLKADFAHMKGWKCVLIQDLPLMERDDAAYRYRPALFISLHMNAGAASATGTEVWIDPLASGTAKTFAHACSRAVSRAMTIPNRGIKKNWWAVLRKNKHDALVEMCFMPHDLKTYEKNVDKVELAILNSITGTLGYRTYKALPREA